MKAHSVQSVQLTAEIAMRLHYEAAAHGGVAGAAVLHWAKQDHTPPPGAYGEGECAFCGAAVWRAPTSDHVNQEVTLRGLRACVICCCCAEAYRRAGAGLVRA